eukprot:g334.t1
MDGNKSIDSYTIPTKLIYKVQTKAGAATVSPDLLANIKAFTIQDNGKSTEYQHIMRDIQSFIPDNVKEKYTAVLYKDQQYTKIIDTPEKYAVDIIQYYIKKQPMKQLKYVSRQIQQLKEILDENIITPAILSTISHQAKNVRMENTYQALLKLKKLSTDRYYSVGFTLPLTTQIVNYMNTSVSMKENAITKISQLATKIILNLLQTNNTRTMIFDNIKIINRIKSIYFNRNDRSIYKRQDDFVLALYSIVSTDIGLYKFMGSRTNYGYSFQWLYVLQRQLEHSRTFTIQYNILETLNICLYNTSPGEVSKYNNQHYPQNTYNVSSLPTIINEKIFSAQRFQFKMNASDTKNATGHYYFQKLRTIHIAYAIFNEYKSKYKRYVLGTRSMWKQHINSLKWIEYILSNTVQIGASFKPSTNLLINIMGLISNAMDTTVSTISHDNIYSDGDKLSTTSSTIAIDKDATASASSVALNKTIDDLDLYFLLRLANDEKLKLIRPYLCNVISKILCSSDQFAESMATKETILELMALTLFADNDSTQFEEENTQTNSTVTNLNVQLCLALILRSASKTTIQSVMSENISLLTEFFEYIYAKVSRSGINNASAYKGYCIILSSCIMCICKTTHLGKYRKLIYKIIFHIIESASLRSSWMKNAAFSIWLIAQDEHQSRLLISSHHPPPASVEVYVYMSRG